MKIIIGYFHHCRYIYVSKITSLYSSYISYNKLRFAYAFTWTSDLRRLIFDVNLRAFYMQQQQQLAYMHRRKSSHTSYIRVSLGRLAKDNMHVRMYIQFYIWSARASDAELLSSREHAASNIIHEKSQSTKKKEKVERERRSRKKSKQTNDYCLWNRTDDPSSVNNRK